MKEVELLFLLGLDYKIEYIQEFYNYLNYFEIMWQFLNYSGLQFFPNLDFSFSKAPVVVSLFLEYHSSNSLEHSSEIKKPLHSLSNQGITFKYTYRSKEHESVSNSYLTFPQSFFQIYVAGTATTFLLVWNRVEISSI